MKRAAPPTPDRAPTSARADKIVAELTANPGEWFDISDSVNNDTVPSRLSLINNLYRHAGRYHTPLRVVQRSGSVFAIWDEGQR